MEAWAKLQQGNTEMRSREQNCPELWNHSMIQTADCLRIEKMRNTISRKSCERKKKGRQGMLRLTVSTEEYLMIGDDIKIVFLGGSKNHTRVMLDIPKDVNVVRSKVIEANTTDPKEKEKLSHYYAVPELPEKYRKKKAAARQ